MIWKPFKDPVISVDVRGMISKSGYTICKSETCWILISREVEEKFHLVNNWKSVISDRYISYLVKLECDREDIQFPYNGIVVSYPNETLSAFLARTGFIELKV